MAKNQSDEPKKGGTPSREILYSEAAKYTLRAIEVLVREMENGDNSNARVSAAKAILAKSLPDQKALELSGPDGGPIQLRYIIDLSGGYIPPVGPTSATSSGRDAGSTPVQGIGMAPTGEENNNGSDRTGQTSTV